MKTMILTLASLLLLSWPVPAQSQPPSAELSPYEEQRYGDRLWEVPREPYQSGYKFEEYNSKLYEAPGPAPARPKSSRPKSSRPGRVQGGSPINTSPSISQSPTRAQQRFQTQQRFQNQQRQISERSRVKVPAAPLQAGPGQPAGTRPFKP